MGRGKHRTEAERAEDAYGIALRKVRRLERKRTTVRDTLESVEAELREARQVLDYRASHPSIDGIVGSDDAPMFETVGETTVEYEKPRKEDG